MGTRWYSGHHWARAPTATFDPYSGSRSATDLSTRIVAIVPFLHRLAAVGRANFAHGVAELDVLGGMLDEAGVEAEPVHADRDAVARRVEIAGGAVGVVARDRRRDALAAHAGPDRAKLLDIAVNRFVDT